MIYLVTNQKQLFDSDLYEIIGPDIALNKLKSVEKDPEIGFKLLGADTETTGLNFLKNKILTIQLGTEEWQIVWDCTSVPIHMLKIILEDEEYLTIWWNYLFDGLFLYKERIIPPNVYDGMIAEKLMYLGIDYKDRLIDTKNEVGEEYTPYSLKTAIKRYCNQELDKSVRGKIITRGLTPEVIVYAANDVKWEIPMLKNQYKALKEKDLVEAAKFENAFLPSLVYWKYCGVKLDIPRWKNKMKKDKQLLEEKEKALNEWVYDFYKKNSIGKNLVKVDLAVRKHTFGLGSVALLEIPSYYKPVRWYQEEEVDEDGTVWRIDKGEFEVPFGYFDKHKKLVPYIGKDIQLDLFAEVNTEEHCVIDWNSPGTLVPLFDMLGFKTTTFDKKTKKEKKSVSAKIIEPQSDISPIGKIYLAYKKAFKVVSSYGQNWLDQVDVDGRIHPEYNQLGTATARLSSGKGDSDGLDHDADDDSINIQNLPRDAETRACFCAENGNMWISEDYDSQESQIMASVTNDPAMLEFYRNGGGDMHSLVAKMSYPEIIGDCPVEEIKGKYRDYRQKAKSIEFAINYGGNGDTIAANDGTITKEEGHKIYDNYMKGFPGVKAYQDYCRKDVIDKGYILLNPITKHKSFFYNWPRVEQIRNEMRDNPYYWEEYRAAKKEGDYMSDIVQDTRFFFKEKSQMEKNAIDYRIQGRGSMCFKLSSIYFFKWIIKNNLFDIVKCCIPVHDESNVEAPEEMAETVSKVLQKCMEKGASPFCTRLHLSTGIEIGKHWIH